MKRGAVPSPRVGAGLGTRADAPPPPSRVTRSLLTWYDVHRRDLPWRSDPSPYRTLVSEFMLQQTVVAAAIPYFERFVIRLPDLRALANASEDEVLALWSGLGYYARGRNLHRAARAVVDRHGGELPTDEPSLRELPGVGPYTAAAIAAIAFGRRTFALDGNAARVVARLAGITASIDNPTTRARLRAVGQTWVPLRRAGDFAQAVMELGATICAPRDPDCAICPLTRVCQARRRNLVARIPARKVRPEKSIVRLVCARLRDPDGNRVFLLRRTSGLLAGTWMLPSRVLTDGDVAQIVLRAVVRETGMAVGRVLRVGHVRHLFTHRDVTAEVFDVMSAQPRAKAIAGAGDALWVDERRLHELAVSSFLRKLLDLKRDKSMDRP